MEDSTQGSTRTRAVGGGAAALHSALTSPPGGAVCKVGRTPRSMKEASWAEAQDHNLGAFCPHAHPRIPSPLQPTPTRDTSQIAHPSPREPEPRLHPCHSPAGHHEGRRTNRPPCHWDRHPLGERPRPPLPSAPSEKKTSPRHPGENFTERVSG